MAFKLFLGDENKVEIICEKRLSCVSVQAINIYLENQDWEGYIALSRGPIYPKVVKTLWVYASVSNNGNYITSSIFGIPFVTTQSSIAETIRCPSEPTSANHKILHD